MDIGELQTKETTSKVIKHPQTGADTDIVVEFYGHDSLQHRKVQHDAIQKAKKDKESGIDVMSPEYRMNSEVAMLAALTVSIDNLEMNGVAYGADKAQEVYKTCRWLYEQIEQDVYNRSLFFVSAQTV